MRGPAVFRAAPLLLSAPAGRVRAGTTEVRLRLPLRPKLAVTGRERVALAPFLVAHKLSERKDDREGPRPRRRVPPPPRQADRTADQAERRDDARRR